MPHHLVNPYFAGPPATQPETFFGREDVLRFVDDTLASPMHNAIVFYGQRRIGKTSILHQIARRSGQDYQAVFFDLQSRVVESPVHDLLYGLAREIAGQLNLPSPNRTDFQQDLELFRTDFLPRVYEHVGNRRLLLLLDEFDALSQEANLTELDGLPFVQALNRIIQSDDKRIVFLFVVGRRLKDLSAYHLQVFRGAFDRQITLLGREACLQLITQPAQEILTYDQAATERIWSLTSGHPYYTQLICHKVFNQAQHQEEWFVTEAHVEAVIDEAISAGQTALQWFWNEVPPVERFTLYTIGQLAPEGQAATLDQLIAQRDLRRVQVPDIELKGLPDKLVDRQVLRRDAGGLYAFAVELVRRWIVQNHSLEEVSAELTRVAVDESAKDFFRAGLAAFQNEDLSFALDSFSRALGINPDYVEARLWLARTRLKKGDLLTAINEFTYVERYGGREAKDARVGLADARAQYGRHLEEEGKIEEAIQEYRWVLQLDEQHPLANTRLSQIFCRQADELLEKEGFTAARPLYEKAIIHRTEPDLEQKIKARLDQYSQVQEAAYNWEVAEQARQLASKISQTDDDQEALLHLRLGWGRWLLDQYEFDEAALVYRRLIDETGTETARQMIENDILRFSQQAEEKTQWKRVKAALNLLVDLFPDDAANKNRLADSLCRQGEFHLARNELDQAKTGYRQALLTASSEEVVTDLIREGFQNYRRQHQQQDTLRSRQLVVEAMVALVDILGQDDARAYQWLSTSRMELGDVLRRDNNKLNEAREAYLQALDDTTHWLQLTLKTEEPNHQRAEIGLKLSQVELDLGAFNEAVDSAQQALSDPTLEQQMAHQIKTTFNDYRHRQEQEFGWDLAKRAVEVLAHLFPTDEEVNFWLAETCVAQADWHLRRAIPDLDAARHLAQEAIGIDLPFEYRHVIRTRLKETFRASSERQVKASPPKWGQAEWILNSLVSLFPGDTELHQALVELRAGQGDWYLSQAIEIPLQTRGYLLKAAEAYRRALIDSPLDESLVIRLKNGFRDFRTQHPSLWMQAGPAIKILAESVPDDEEIQQWLAETEPAAVSAWKGYVGRWWPIMVPLVVALLIIGGSFAWRIFSPSPVSSRGGTSTVSSSSPEKPPPSEEAPSTKEESQPAAALIPTEEPTGTPTSEPPTETPPPPTQTSTPTSEPPPTPTLTLTATPTSTSSPTITPTPTKTPTPTETPPPTPYPSPQLIRPNNGAVFRGATSLPALAWDPVDELASDEYYRVKFTAPEGQIRYSFLLTDTAWNVSADRFHWANLLHTEPPARQIEWQVQVVREGEEEPIELSASQTWAFTWQPELLPAGAALQVALNPDNPLEIWVVLEEEGIYKSDNGGIDWEQVLDNSSVETVHIAPANSKTVYAGVFRYLLQSQDGAKEWQLWQTGVGTQILEAQVFDIISHPQNADLIFAATGRGVLGSKNGGQSWLALDRADRPDGPVLNDSFYSLVAAGTRLYATGAGNRIYSRVLNDFENPWRSQVCSPCSPPILSLAVDPQNSNKILAGSDQGSLALSLDRGQSWNEVKLTPSTPRTLKVSALAIDPADPRTVYLGTGNSRHPTDGEGLYRSQDGGVTWHPFNNWQTGSGRETYIQSIALDPADSQIIYIAGSEGVYCSNNGGTSWTKL